jgi:hypothetical protein
MLHVFSEHLSPVEESAGNKKTEGRNDLANYNGLRSKARALRLSRRSGNPKKKKGAS